MRKIISSTKFKVFFLFLVAFLPRIINLGGHDILADEISWMPRAKDVYAAVRTLSWSPYNTKWWLSPKSAEAIGLPVTFLAGFSIEYLSPGYSTHSLNLMPDYVAGRLPVALIGALFIPIFYFLLKRFVNEKLAFVTSFLLALDPIAIALSRWLRQDNALTVFSVLALMLFLIDEGWPTLVLSSFFTSMAILTKPQGFLLLFTLILFYIILLLTRGKINLKRLVAWLIASAGFTIILFPYLWGNPIGNMLNYISIQTNHAVLGNLNFFNGTITGNPPWYYYFAIFPFRVPESLLLGFLVGLAICLIGIKKIRFSCRFKKQECCSDKFFLMSTIYSVLYIAFMSIYSLKFGIRYMFPIWPYIYVLAASGIIYIESLIKPKMLRIFLWVIVTAFPIWGILEFSPIYYLYHNNLIGPARFQNLESIAQCDGVGPALQYLGPNLHQNIKIMLLGCDAAINYYTGYTVDKVQNVSDNPEYIIEEYNNNQMHPEIYEGIKNIGYKEIKQITFRGIILADIYQKSPKL